MQVLQFQTTPRRPRAVATVALVAATVALGACGSSSGTSTTAAQQAPRQGGPFASLSADARACLQKQGVSPPNGRRPGNGGPPNGQPPAGTAGRPANSDRFAKMRAALKKCGVNLPARPPGAGPPQGAPTGTGSNQ